MKKSVDQLIQELRELDRIFDENNYSHCVARAMLLLRINEASYLSRGYSWPLNVEALRWNIERAINHRPSFDSMMFAAIGEIENIKSEVARYNAIPIESEREGRRAIV